MTVGTASNPLGIKTNDEILFTDNGQIRSLDDNHRILFRRSENLFEIREYGDIIFSPGATTGAETAKVVMESNGNLWTDGCIYNYGSCMYGEGMSTYVMNTDHWYESGNDGGWMSLGTSNAEINIRGSVLFDCPSCGSSSALDGSSNWGDMTVQGRVISANSNLHLSPPAGYNVVINDSYRAAGGAGGGVAGLSVEGNITAGGTIHGSLGRSDCYWNTAAPSMAQIQTCNSGYYMAGFDSYVILGIYAKRIYCCKP